MAMKYKADYNVFSLVCINDQESKIKDASMINYVNEKLSYFIPEFGEFIATAEHDKTLYAMRDLEQLMGSEITWVRGKNFDDILTSKNTHGGCPTRLPSKQLRYCTDEMKLVPIFKWWLLNIGVKVKMRIGFRHDEFDRMERFFNNNPNHFKFPNYSKTYGNKQMHHENYNWRYCSFDLVKDHIDEIHVKEFWQDKNIDFPLISNCTGCPFKKKETIAIMAEDQPAKINWFAAQEDLGKGTWIKDITYNEIINNRHEIAKEQMLEYFQLGEICDSGGCSSD